MYNSDTVYMTTTFRPVSPSPITPPLNTPSPQRTRKLETPLHFDGGLFSDIRSTDGKLLSKVTVDRVQKSSRHDITDSPSVVTDGHNYVDDIVKTETITNENVITVKFTPVAPELDSPRLLTPSQMYRAQQKSPVEYLKDNFEDLQSYKIVNSVCKEKLLEKDNLEPVFKEGRISESREIFVNSTCKESFLQKDVFELNEKGKTANTINAYESIKRGPSPLANLAAYEPIKRSPSPLVNLEAHEPIKRGTSPLSNLKVYEPIKRSPSPLANLEAYEPIKRGPSPLANILISEHLSKIDSYLQESLDVCSGVKGRVTPIPINIEGYDKSGQISDVEKVPHAEEKHEPQVAYATTATSQTTNESKQSSSECQEERFGYRATRTPEPFVDPASKLNSDKQRGVLSAIYNMPIHYHAAILCFFLILYNLIYQYVKQNCHGSKK
nr:uncharacterized protein LOC126055982 [Helicoverpa armigera]